MGRDIWLAHVLGQLNICSAGLRTIGGSNLTLTLSYQSLGFRGHSVGWAHSLWLTMETLEFPQTTYSFVLTDSNFLA